MKVNTQIKDLSTPNSVTPAQRLEHSRRRSEKLSAARIRNLKYHKQITPEVNSKLREVEAGRGDEYPEALPYLEQYQKRLITCCSNALYRRLNNSRACSLISAQTCNHRLCNVCNMLRSRKLRRKWRDFLTDTIQDVPIKYKQAHFFDIPAEDYEPEFKGFNKKGKAIYRRPKDIYFTSGADLLQRFDLMHLTLTVPHKNGLWNGKSYYAQELLEKFNFMRKSSWWTEYIFGGEYTVETTKTGNGLHIHIHALLFVDKRLYRSRNFLSEKILRSWNILTIDRTVSVDIDKPKAERYLLDEKRRKGIADGYAFLDEDNLNNLILDLDNRGSTMVGLKSLYFEVKPNELHRYSANRIFEQNGKMYSYSHGRHTESVLKGIVECLKYHFEPCVLETTTGELDMEMVEAILPNIYRQRLYGKFGGMYGVKRLNVVEEPLSDEDIMEDAAAHAKEAFDPITGTEIAKSQYFYAIADARSISFDDSKPIYYLARDKIKKSITSDIAPDLRTALQYLVLYGYKNAS